LRVADEPGWGMIEPCICRTENHMWQLLKSVKTAHERQLRSNPKSSILRGDHSGANSSSSRLHVRNILKKLNAANRTPAAFVANRLLGKKCGACSPADSPRPIDQAQSPVPKR
jgi:hypothetical protein